MTAAGRWFRRLAAAVLTMALIGLLATPAAISEQAPESREETTCAVQVRYTAAPTEVTAAEAEYIPPAADVEALAKMLYGEARGVASDTEKAACVWVVLNRVDDPHFPDTVLGVLEAPAQFIGYSPDNPATEELKALAADVLTRHHEEEQGAADAGRVIPREYLFFTGDGERNYFTAEWNDSEIWGWTLESPYDD